MNIHLLEDCHQFHLRPIVDLANKILLSLIQFAEMSHPLQNSYYFVSPVIHYYMYTVPAVLFYNSEIEIRKMHLLFTSTH